MTLAQIANQAAAGRLRTLELIEGSNAAMVANGRLVG